MEYSSYLISKDREDLKEVTKYIPKEPVTWFDGNGYESFSQLVNSCIEAADTEIVFIMSHRVSPEPQHFKLALDLLKKGHGLVGLYRLAFFAFKKEVFRQIGMMDERFLGGSYEDDDLYVRLVEANISMYLTHDVEYRYGDSTWNQTNHCWEHCFTKWNGIPKTTLAPKRMLEEEKYSYDLGPSVATKFLPTSESFIYPHWMRWQSYLHMRF